MAINYRQELEGQYMSLRDRLAQIDQKMRTVDPLVRQQSLAGLNPSTMGAGVTPADVVSGFGGALEYSMNSRAQREGALSERQKALQAIGDYDQQQFSNNIAREELGLKKGAGAGGLDAVSKLIDVRDKLAKAGKDTTLFDQQLMALGINPAQAGAKPEHQEIVSLVDELLSSDLDAVVGFNRLGQFFGQGTTTKAKIDQLGGKLGLAMRKDLVGQGTLSDKEQDMINKAVAALDRGQGVDQFKKELLKIKNKYGGGTGGKSQTVGGYVIEEVK